MSVKPWGHGPCHKVGTLPLISAKEMSKQEYLHTGSPPLSDSTFSYHGNGAKT